jgi:hypothetical protein
VTWLVAAAVRADASALRDGDPERWRSLRRFNLPVQLAITASHDVASHARSAESAGLIALAPCQSGSPELHHWVRIFAAGGSIRINPTHTMHAVDNLALSAVSIALRNRAWGMSLGGAPGMFWVGLELAAERLEEQAEVVVFGGDQEISDRVSPAAGVALLFSREPAADAGSGRSIRLVSVERRRASVVSRPRGHATAGACEMLAQVKAQPPGRYIYEVPAVHGDGIDEISIHWELA